MTKRDYIPCPDCLTVRLQASKIVEHGRTLQMVCPDCGKLVYVPIWGSRRISHQKSPDPSDRRILRRRELRVTLKSVTPKHRKVTR